MRALILLSLLAAIGAADPEQLTMADGRVLCGIVIPTGVGSHKAVVSLVGRVAASVTISLDDVKSREPYVAPPEPPVPVPVSTSIQASKPPKIDGPKNPFEEASRKIAENEMQCAELGAKLQETRNQIGRLKVGILTDLVLSGDIGLVSVSVTANATKEESAKAARALELNQYLEALQVNRRECAGDRQLAEHRVRDVPVHFWPLYSEFKGVPIPYAN